MFENFYEEYVSIQSKNGNMYSVKCPFTESHSGGDKKSSAGIDPDTGVFNCFVCGARSPEKFLNELLNISFAEAGIIVDAFREEYGLKVFADKPENNFTVKWRYTPKFQLIYDNCNEYDPTDSLISTYCEVKQFTPEFLEQQGIRVIEKQYVNEKWARRCLVFPYYVNNRIVGLRYRDINGNKSAEPGSYFVPWGLNLLTEDQDVVLVTEGETDSLTAKMLVSEAELDSKIGVLGLPTSGFRKEWIRELSSINKLVFIPQTDNAAEKTLKEYHEIYKKDPEVISIPWKSGQFGKDLNEWREQNEATFFLRELSSFVQRTLIQVYSYEDFLEANMSEEPEFLIKNLLNKGEISFIAGAQKSFKTFMALEKIRCILTGESFLGYEQLTGCGEPINILIVEEEGTRRDFAKRMQQTFEGLDIEGRIHIMHRSGIRLEDKYWRDVLDKTIEEHEIGYILGDPFQDLHEKNEDSATEMGAVWASIRYLQRMYPKLSMDIIHHFNKAGDLSSPWKAMRGSSRSAGACDVATFIKRRSMGKIIDFVIDGREIPDIELPGSSKYLHATFNGDTGRLQKEVLSDNADIPNWMRIYRMLITMKGQKLPLNEISSMFGKTDATIKRWVGESGNALGKTKPAPGSPVVVFVASEENKKYEAEREETES